MEDSYRWAYDHSVLNSVLLDLTVAHVAKAAAHPNFSDKQVRTACFVASHLSDSPDVQHKKKAQLFAALAHARLPSSRHIETLCYAIFARTGALPATRHLEGIVDTQQHFVGGNLGLLSLEFEQAYANCFTPLAGGTVVTEFQKQAIDVLKHQQRAIFSAPTSAGKSFVVHESIKLRLKSNEKFYALLIVPTKALIAQFSYLYWKYKNANDFDFPILTSVPEGLEIKTNKAVFVLTQERCIRLLSSKFAHEIDFIFADEIQSVEQSSRGALLEYVLSELEHKSPRAQFFAAGPYIENVHRLAGEVFVEKASGVATKLSPVSQVVVQIAPIKDKKEIVLTVLDDTRKEHDKRFVIPVEKKLHSRWKTQWKAVIDAVSTFGQGDSSIVYAPGPKTAQKWAQKYVEGLNKKDDPSEVLLELVEYLEESIHPRCSLIEGLKCGVAYHHAGLPDFIREEVEERFSSRDIDTLFCTSTLLEGVNLPTEKIFLVSPKKADVPLTDFEFKNLIGRAGRLNEHLSGCIYCIYSPDDSNGNGESWVDRYRTKRGKYVQPAIENHLKTRFADVCTTIAEGIVLSPDKDRDVGLRSTITLLRSKFLADPESAEAYIYRKKIPEANKKKLISSLIGSMDHFEIDKELASNNPYIDPFLQDKLYRSIRENPSNWKIRSGFGFSTDLKNTFKSLDNVFSIIEDINPIGNEKIYRDRLLNFSKKWLFGTSFRELVDWVIPKKVKESGKLRHEVVDNAIVEVTDFINKGVSYQLAKYYRLVSDILGSIIPMQEQSDYAFAMSLSTMLELGCSDPKALALMTACVPRSTALRVAKKIPDTDQPVAWLVANQNDSVFDALPAIHRKILKRSGIWI